MRAFVGTSGYSYVEWKGHFYPEKMKSDAMLAFYGSQFSTVEINASFYRMPKLEVVRKWAGEVPSRFRFTLKAPQQITHHRKLVEIESALELFLQARAELADKCGPILVQLPPYLKKDVPLLEAFLKQVPSEVPVALEFGHASWQDEEVNAALRARNVASVVIDDPKKDRPLVVTADWAYARLRRTAYTDDELARIADELVGHGLKEAWVYFKHEDEGTGPKLAKRFLAQLAAKGISADI